MGQPGNSGPKALEINDFEGWRNFAAARVLVDRGSAADGTAKPVSALAPGLRFECALRALSEGNGLSCAP